MKFNVLYYTFKIWLCCVVTSPLSMVICQYILMGSIDRTYFVIYPAMLVIEVFYSFATWFFFWVITEIIIMISPKLWLRKSLVTMAGIILTYYIFREISPVDLYAFNDMTFMMLLSNTLLVVFGSWYFNIEPKTEPKTLPDSILSTHPNEN